MTADSTVDTCTKAVAETALENGYTVLITADHGNSELMVNPDGTPNTAHTTNPVPLHFLDNEYRPCLRHGKLGDIAPTILELMGIEKSQQMSRRIPSIEHNRLLLWRQNQRHTGNRDELTWNFTRSG